MNIGELIEVPKSLVLPARRKNKQHRNHTEIDFQVASEVEGEFVVFVRLSTSLLESYSIGLRWRGDMGGAILLRLNGDHGAHANPDGTRFESGAHLHAPTTAERALLPSYGFVPRHAEPVPDCRLLPDGWRQFLDVARLSSSSAADSLILRIHESGSQLDFLADLPELT